MKKLLSLLLVAVMTMFFAIGAPAQSSATESSSEQEVELTASKKITGYRIIFKGEITAPVTYIYNTGQWKGTLTKDYQVSTDGYTFAYYSGTVYCSAPCAMTKNTDGE